MEVTAAAISQQDQFRLAVSTVERCAAIALYRLTFGAFAPRVNQFVGGTAIDELHDICPMGAE